MTLKVITCNVNGLADREKRKTFFCYLYNKQIDIAFVQETHATKSQIKRWKNEWGGRILASNYLSNSRGVATLFRRDFCFELLDNAPDLEGRCLLTKIKHNEQSMLLANIYAPNEDKPQFFSELFENITKHEAEHFILGGDFQQNPMSRAR